MRSCRATSDKPSVISRTSSSRPPSPVLIPHSRLTHLTAPSTPLFLRIASLAYYLLPPSSQALSTLKQCLHYDPDSKPCASAHRQFKKFDKATASLDALAGAGDWHGVIRLAPELAGTFDAALDVALGAEALPASVLPRKRSPRRREVYSTMCRAYVAIDVPCKAESWCDEVLRMEGGENDVEALKGKGEASLAREEWEEATTLLEARVRGQGAVQPGGESRMDLSQCYRSHVRQMQTRLQRAQRLLKQSKKKDYYKLQGARHGM